MCNSEANSLSLFSYVCILQDMFDLLISLGAKDSMNTVNGRGLTPFTLAATLARSKVRSCLFSYLLASNSSART